MKKIKPHVNTYCTFCKKAGIEKIRAEWRLPHEKDCACDQHRPELRAVEEASRDDGHRTEADYQTWMRL